MQTLPPELIEKHMAPWLPTAALGRLRAAHFAWLQEELQRRRSWHLEARRRVLRLWKMFMQLAADHIQFQNLCATYRAVYDDDGLLRKLFDESDALRLSLRFFLGSENEIGITFLGGSMQGEVTLQARWNHTNEHISLTCLVEGGVQREWTLYDDHVGAFVLGVWPPLLEAYF